MVELPLLRKSAKDAEKKWTEELGWKEKPYLPPSAYYVLIIHLLLTILGLGILGYKGWGQIGLFLLFLSVLACFGYFVVNPGEAKVILQFGEYLGTVKQPGFYWTMPYCRKLKLSLKKISTTTDVVHAHDAYGDPIRLAATLVWKVHDTAQAVFQVADFSTLVKNKTMMVLKNIANAYPLEAPENQVSLRRYALVLSEALKKDLNQRLAGVGMLIEEAKIIHLSYSPEILGQKAKLQSLGTEQHIDLAIATLQKIEQKAALQALSDEQKLQFILSFLLAKTPS